MSLRLSDFLFYHWSHDSVVAAFLDASRRQSHPEAVKAYAWHTFSLAVHILPCITLACDQANLLTNSLQWFALLLHQYNLSAFCGEM